ncbi:MAG: DUF4842 domain-containing protein [Prevotellaceae bacterium]|nr:DUF4842 domain-containing protein [Prevotellaceae bacterium]
MAKTLKITAAFIASAVMATLPLATSCTDYDNGFDEAAIRYNQSFIDRFGNIDPNQDWNLVRQLAENNGGGKSTRAYDYGDINENKNAPNSNQWGNNQWKLVVPGYPDSKGIYYIDDNGHNGGGTIQYMKESELGESEHNPIGDVTEEEIVYVSQWFRTHYKPQSLKVNWRNFFLQDISHDADRRIDYDEQKSIYTCDNDERLLEKPLLNADGTEEGTISTNYYPMDQLYAKTLNGGWNHLYNFNNNSGNLFQQLESVPRFENFGTSENYENNAFVDKTSYSYNLSANSPTYDPETYNLEKRTMQLYVGIGTEDFAYECTYDHTGQKYRKYVLVHLIFDIQQIGLCKIHGTGCESHHYDGYYLGFDYQAYKEMYTNDGQLQKYIYWERDGFYSNWIVKISNTPFQPEDSDFEPEGGDPEPDPNPDEDEEDLVAPNSIREQGLLVCEDLGDKAVDADFDFNDVVLKLQHIHESGTNIDKLKITAMAAGGTLPSDIYYKGREEENKVNANGVSEIHRLLNSNVPKIINAGEKFVGEGHSWTYPISADELAQVPEGSGFVSYVFDNGLIQIKVNNSNWIKPVNNGYHNKEKNDDYTTIGTPPQMMLLPISFQWPREGVYIENAYPEFTKWVNDKSVTNWYEYSKANHQLVTKRNVTEQEVVESFGWVDDISKLTLTIGEGKTLEINYTGAISRVNIPSSNGYIDVDVNNDNKTLTIKSTGSGNPNEVVHIEIYDSYNNKYDLYVTLEKEDVPDDGKLKWDDGSTTKTVPLFVGKTEYVSCRNANNILIEGAESYSDDYVDITIQNKNMLVIVAKKAGDVNGIKISQGTESITLNVNVKEVGALVDRPKDNPNLQWGTALDYFDGTQQWGLSNEPQTLNMKPNDVANIRIQDITNGSADYTPNVEGDTDCVKVDYDDTNNNKNCKITAIKKGTAKLVIPFPSVSGYNGEQYNETSITITINVSDNVSEE